MPDRLTVWGKAPSSTVTLLSVFRVGAWFTELTVTVKVRLVTLLLAAPLLTVTVITAEPFPRPSGAKEIEPVVFGLV
jgi:hypothetical protein